MRWFAILIAAVAGMGLFAHGAGADPSNPALIESITFDDQPPNIDRISITLSQYVEPKIFIMGGDNPRLVLDFLQSEYRGRSTIPLSGGNLAQRIRVGLHRTPVLKTRVVIDLIKASKVHFTQTYSELDKTLVVRLAPAQPVAQMPESSEKQSSPEAQQSVDQSQPEKEPVVVAPPPQEEKPGAEPGDAQPAAEKPPAAPEPVVETTEEGGSGEWGPSSVSPQLLDISFDNSSNTGEMVLFHLNDFYPPTVSAIEKENPRVICDFMHMGLAEGVQENIAAEGKFVKQIRAEKHENPDKVRITLDLSPDRDYDLQQVFFKNDNLFVLIVNELPEKRAIE